MSNKKSVQSSMLILIASFIWGTAFVAQSNGMDYIGPITFVAVRNYIGALFLVPCIILIDVINKKKPTFWGSATTKQSRKNLILGGIVTGVLLALASSLQQFGIIYTTIGKAGFITTLYIVIVPIIGLFMGKKISGSLWFAILLSSIGMYFMCISGVISLSVGDLAVLLCAFAFSFQILSIDYFAKLTDTVRMACAQFVVCAIVSTIAMFILETPTIDGIIAATLPLLYTGIMSSGIAYTLQIVGQKHTPPAIACLIFGLESVFSAVAGWLLLGEMMNSREIFGASLIFIAVVFAQIAPYFSFGKKKV